MAMAINTNIPSLNAQRNLVKNQAALNKSLQRLSSGLRINSAKDDAAGLAISTRFTAQIRGLDQAVRNSNDGISLLQTSEGAMQEVTNILMRMRELAVQASNDTNTSSDRASLQREVDQLYTEIDRIAGSTQFNGINLLDGTGGTKQFQIGANAGQTISVTLGSVKTRDLNLNGYSGLGELNSGRVAGDFSGSGLTINGVAIDGATAATSTNNTAFVAATQINKKTTDTGVTATAYNTYRGGAGSGITGTGLTINGDTVTSAGSMQGLVENINRDVAGVTATLNSDGTISLSNDTGKEINIEGDVTNTGFATGTYQGYLSLKSADGAAISITATSTNSALQKWGFNASAGSTTVTGGAVTTNSLKAGDLVINGVSIGDSTGSSAGDKASAINEKTAQTGVRAEAVTTKAFQVTTNMGTASSITINGTSVDLSSSTTLSAAVEKINTSVKGVQASLDNTGKLVLTSVSGLDITVTDADTNKFFMLSGTGSSTETVYGTITLTSQTGADVIIGGKNEAYAGFVEQGGSSDAVGSGLSVMTIANAGNAIKRIDDALNKVSTNRGELGAVQNRLDSTISNLMNVSENLSAANGRIVDADFAAETANMTKSQILSQAGVAMLAQAKQLPQQVLSLLQ
ncbi:flagellin [Desulfatirhabdium butyrativorans]|uniref:flagellin N-terminal helical domain-containing protein n=1 Tax=Desulfatirhabdium butyrativorans TaxID=340467 RepID=UPI000415686F|nr:flagellin [Desulfatirhabdium butyrativorans]